MVWQFMIPCITVAGELLSWLQITWCLVDRSPVDHVNAATLASYTVHVRQQLARPMYSAATAATFGTSQVADFNQWRTHSNVCSDSERVVKDRECGEGWRVRVRVRLTLTLTCEELTRVYVLTVKISEAWWRTGNVGRGGGLDLRA